MPITALENLSSKVNFNNYDSGFFYYVKNRVCIVKIWSVNITEDCGSELICSNIPIPGTSICGALVNGVDFIGMAYITADGKLYFNSLKRDMSGYCSIVYPI